MRKLVCAATVLGVLSGVAYAQDPNGTVTTTAPAASGAIEPIDQPLPSNEEYGPDKFEVGLYLGSFISNYYHQFYDDTIFPARVPNNPDTNPANRQQLDRLDPQFGLRFAVFPHPNF